MDLRWLEGTVRTDPFLAEALVEEHIGNTLHQQGQNRAVGAKRSLRWARLSPDGWLARQARRVLCGLGIRLVALGQRLHQYGLMSTTPTGDRS